MTRAELESKHLAELHAIAAEAGIQRYRMLPREQLIERLAEGQERQPRERRPRQERRREPRPAEAPKPQPAAAEPEAEPEPATSRPRRRRRRWGRRSRRQLRVHDLLLPPAVGRQAIIQAESREGCTALLRELAAELAGSPKGPDPIALLVEPTPEELADWRREAPRAEIVAAGQARHADDAIAQARRRAGDGEDVIVLIDSLSRFAEAFGGGDAARELFEAGRETSGGGSLTVVGAVERQ